MMEFVNSNFFQTMMLTLVGLITWVIYITQKKETIRKAASIAILEIDSIEKRLNELSFLNDVEEIYKTVPIYQSVEWYKIRDLFIHKIDIGYIDAINKFYEMVIICEDARSKVKEMVHLNRINKIFATQECVANVLLDISEKVDPKDQDIEITLEKAAERLTNYKNLYDNCAVDFLMNSVLAHWRKAVSSKFLISNTPAYEHLKKLIRKDFF